MMMVLEVSRFRLKVSTRERERERVYTTRGFNTMHVFFIRTGL